MSWLEDLNQDRIYNYEFVDSPGEYVCGKLAELSEMSGSEVKGEPQEKIVIEERELIYAGFEPLQLRQELQVEYEQNGRKAIHYVDKNGNHRYMSKSKQNFLKTGKVQRELSKAMVSKIDENIQRELQALEKAKESSK